MATELGRFLSEQLARLPESHEDRVFIEGIAQTTAGYINKSPLTQEIQEESAVHGVDLVRLGQVLQQARNDFGMSRTEMSRRTGIDRYSLWVYERGENPKTKKPSKPSKDKLEKIARTLRFDPEKQREVMILAGFEESI